MAIETLRAATGGAHRRARRGRRSGHPARGGFRLAVVVGLLLCLSLSSAKRGNAQSASAPTGVLTVFAAASLTEAFMEIGRRLEALYPGLRMRFNFAGSQALRTQLEQGAPADVFASADTAQMSLAKQSGMVRGETPIFVKNRLVAIVPRDNPGQVSAFSDLAKPGLRLVLAGPHVPAGRYSRQAIQRATADYGADFDEQVQRNLVSEEHNVKQVVTKVQLGEADAGISYISDITPSVGQEVRIIPIPDAYNQIATYPIATVKGAQNPAAAEVFMQFVLSHEGQKIMASYQFIPIEEP